MLLFKCEIVISAGASVQHFVLLLDFIGFLKVITSRGQSESQEAVI